VVVEAVLETPEGTVEECCERLARRRQFLYGGEVRIWPDGTATTYYGFTHSLYQHALLQRVTVVKQLRFHQRIGERLESGYGTETKEVAGELAVHFEHGRAYQRAIRYLRQVAEQAARRYARHEAIDALTRALALADQEPESERVFLHINILMQRGLIRRSMGDTRAAAQDFIALAQYAGERGQKEWEVKALLHLASTRSWIDHEQCLAAAEQAVALSEDSTNEGLRIHARAYSGYWQSLLDGWREEHVQACGEAVRLARQQEDYVLLGLHVGRHLYFHCLRSPYRATCRLAEEERQVALTEGDANHYVTCQFFRAWALLHWGQWGEMQEILREGEQIAEKNQHFVWGVAFQLERAWLHEQAGDFVQARALSAQGFARSREVKHQYNQILSRLLLGKAHLGLGEYEQAFQYLSKITDRPGRVVMDWILRMPFLLSLSEYWFAQREYKRAREETERLCEIAAQPGERTYLALGRRMLAEIALVQRRQEDAEQEVTLAFAVLDGVEAPLAEWRVHTTAARLAEQRRRKDQARTHWERSKAVVLRLADSLDQDNALRQTFLACPAVQEVLQGG
jgi:tetratricopeptide (TPR) repeat protein